jgi:archaellum component FlaC
MDEENTTFRGATIDMDETVEETRADQETPFDRLETRIDTLIDRYERLASEHNQCGEKLTLQEARIRELEAKLEQSEQQTSEVRTRLDTLIEKLNRFS